MRCNLRLFRLGFFVPYFCSARTTQGRWQCHFVRGCETAQHFRSRRASLFLKRARQGGSGADVTRSNVMGAKRAASGLPRRYARNVTFQKCKPRPVTGASSTKLDEEYLLISPQPPATG